MNFHRAISELFDVLAGIVAFTAITLAAIVFGTGIGLLISAALKHLV